MARNNVGIQEKLVKQQVQMKETSNQQIVEGKVMLLEVSTGVSNCHREIKN